MSASLPRVRDGHESPNLPLWLGLLLIVDTVLRRAWKGTSLFVEQVALAAASSSRKRAALTMALYARRKTYGPKGAIFRNGLFEWEKQAVSSPPFPASGTILLGGAGGGREIQGLDEMGYEVIAFEPCSELAEQAIAVAATSRRAKAVEASYEDLIATVADSSGVLAAILRGRRFDGIILGWGSLSHVLDLESRIRLLNATRAVAPHAPVLLSYLTRGPESDAPPQRRWWRAFFEKFGAPSSDRQMRFLPSAGYYRTTTDEEVELLAAQSGYRIEYLKIKPYPHAMLTPALPDAGGLLHPRRPVV